MEPLLFLVFIYMFYMFSMRGLVNFLLLRQQWIINSIFSEIRCEITYSRLFLLHIPNLTLRCVLCRVDAGGFSAIS